MTLEDIFDLSSDVTLVRFKKIKERVDKEYPDEDVLRLELIFSGAICVINKKVPAEDQERWGLAKDNLELLKVKESPEVDKILANMEKNKKLMPVYLAQLLLNHKEFPFREFETIQEKLPVIEEEELRKTLIFAGALQFTSSDGKEIWGLASHLLNELGFTSAKLPEKILQKMNSQPSEMPYHLAELLLENPLFYRRTFFAIKKKFGGFSDDEVRSILVKIDAIRFEDKNGKEYWGMEYRNKELINRLKVK